MVPQDVPELELAGLHKDLVALSESRLRAIDRLWLDLEAHIEAFRKLLDKPGKKDASRTAVSSGTVEIDGDKYSINAEFQEETLQLADALDLDEIESARLLLQGQEEAEHLDRSPLACAIIKFHTDRLSLLECIRLVLKQSADEDCNEEIRGALQRMAALILEISDGPARNGSLFARKCISAMTGCENWLHALAERVQRTATLGQTSSFEFDEIMTIQQSSLYEQHESLGAIVTYLVKANYTAVEDFYHVLGHMEKLDKWSTLTIHYVPILLSLISQYGSPEGSSTLRETRGINSRILEAQNSRHWTLPHLQAAMTAWWLAEYSGWYFDQPVGSPLQGVNLEVEAQTQSEAFFQALRDGALQCTLSICSFSRHKTAGSSARLGLTQSLLHDAPPLSFDSLPLTLHFEQLVTEQVENFTAAFISNMPDTLRRFKVEEDDQRRRILSGLQVNPQSGISEQDRHLERFLVIVSYAFDGRADAAAEAFWADNDSNLYGFLQWASRRQSTPCIAAFCEMLMAISEGEECASAAHKFLIEEIPISAGRLRRSVSLSWAQIFQEIELYASKIREYPAAALPSTQQSGRPRPVDIDEPESPMMLECYLRLMQHLCKNSRIPRSWIVSHPTFRVVDTLFLLCSNSVPSGIRTCAYAVLTAVLIDKTSEVGAYIWTTLDLWVSSGFYGAASGPRSARMMNISVSAEESTLEIIASDLEESNSFIRLLQELVSPSIENVDLLDALPFPEQLGSAYRMPGIEPYVDMVLGKVFADSLSKLDDPIKFRVHAGNPIKFACICLESFNEDLLVLAQRSVTAVESAMGTSSLANYARLHPFSRVMEWMFNERVLAALFNLVHLDIREVNGSTPDSPVLQSILHGIKLMALILDFQSTYFDIIRPLIKTQGSGYRSPVSNSSLVSFDDSVISNPSLIVDLGFYAGSGQHELVFASLALLEKLCTSRKLNALQPSNVGSRLTSNRLIGAIQQHGDLEPIARGLTSAVDFDDREMSQGPEAAGYNIKMAIMSFLYNALTSSPDRPTLAHVLLGFHCVGNSITITEDSLFTTRRSLFHSILRIVVDYPDSVNDTMLYWSISLKERCFGTLKCLWISPLTYTYTLAELRAGDYLFVQWLRQTEVENGTIWNDRRNHESGFLFLDSALTLESFLHQRSLLYEYASTELRLATEQGVPLLKARIVSTLLGSTSIDGTEVPNLNIFDLLDFLEVDSPGLPPRPVTQYLQGLDINVCHGPLGGESATAVNLTVLDELHALRFKDLHKHGILGDPASLEKFRDEAAANHGYYVGVNYDARLQEARITALKSWVDLAMLIVQSDDLGRESKSGIVLQALQILTPKLEVYSEAVLIEALIIARFLQILLAQLDFESSTLSSGRAGDVANDRLFQLFRTALRAIQNPDVNGAHREAFYNVCYQYLNCMAKVSDAPLHRRHSIQTLKSAGGALISIICDDGYSGEGECRIAALLFLDALTRLAKEEKTSFMVDSMARINFIAILVETINDMPSELRTANSYGEYYQALSRISSLASLSPADPPQNFRSSLLPTKASSHFCSRLPKLGLVQCKSRMQVSFPQSTPPVCSQ